jgi:hypothetical protein
MPQLTRRRSFDHRQECWEIYYGDAKWFKAPVFKYDVAGTGQYQSV